MGQKLALICEFNPLHKGHQEILSYAKERGGAVIAVMSGNFTQRSAPAVFDKYKRAEAAVKCGADAVLELPFPWCSGGAEFFAFGAVSVAVGVGLHDFVFGSETGETDYVLRAAEVLESDEFADVLAGSAESTEGAAVLYDSALEKFGIKLGSNDKLAAEYVRASRRLGLDADFTAYKRMTDPDRYRSATDLRMMLERGVDVSRFIPDAAREIYGDITDIDPHRFEAILFTYFRMLDSAPCDIFDAGGGVAERLMRAAGNSVCAEDLFKKAATKKYTDSRLRRAALYSYLGVTENALRSTPRFTVLLAANEKGREYISDVRKTKTVKILTKPSAVSGLDDIGKKQHELWRRADELYSLCMRHGVKRGEYLKKSPRLV